MAAERWVSTGFGTKLRQAINACQVFRQSSPSAEGLLHPLELAGNTLEAEDYWISESSLRLQREVAAYMSHHANNSNGLMRTLAPLEDAMKDLSGHLDHWTYVLMDHDLDNQAEIESFAEGRSRTGKVSALILKCKQYGGYTLPRRTNLDLETQIQTNHVTMARRLGGSVLEYDPTIVILTCSDGTHGSDYEKTVQDALTRLDWTDQHRSEARVEDLETGGTMLTGLKGITAVFREDAKEPETVMEYKGTHVILQGVAEATAFLES